MATLKHSFAAKRLGSLLERIRETLHKTSEAFQSEAFHGSLDEVLSVSPEDIKTAESYLLNIGLTSEEGRQFCEEWQHCWDEGGALQVLVRNPPQTLHHQTSLDDPTDPNVANFNRANTERIEKHRKSTNEQRAIAVNALTVLTTHVECLINTIKATAPKITVSEATEVVTKSNGGRCKRDEANIRAREALRNTRKKWSVRSLAKAIGCSQGLVGKLPVWQAYQTDHPRTPKAPKAVSLTDHLLATTSADSDGDELQRLIAEQRNEDTAERRQYRRRAKV